MIKKRQFPCQSLSLWNIFWHYYQHFLSWSIPARNVGMCLPVDMNMNVHTHSLCQLVETTETFINNRMDKPPIFACLFNGMLQSDEKENYGHKQQHR